ncbi:hypothetical protein PV326_009448, partial [Microctonus aethiopoides]
MTQRGWALKLPIAQTQAQLMVDNTDLIQSFLEGTLGKLRYREENEGENGLWVVERRTR